MADSKKYNGSIWEHSLRKLTTATEAVENPLYTDGTAITSYTISGNTAQNGTPTPSNPVEVNGVCVMTENLWDGAIGLDNTRINRTNGTTVADPNYALSDYIPVSASTSYVYSFRHNQYEPNRTSFTVSFYKSNKQLVQEIVLQRVNDEGAIAIPFTTPANTAYIRINWKKPYDDMLMLSLGSTAKPYEPWGYKIPISSAGVTTNIYLGSTQTTRLIKKIVFDGTQSIYSCVRTTDNQNYCCAFKFSEIGMTDIKDYDAAMSGTDYPIFISDRFVNKDSDKRPYYNWISDGEMGANNTGGGGNRYIIFCVSGLTTADDYIEWFTNNPTELYYMLETPQTGIVNEPLMKIGTYADTLSNAAQIPTTEGANSITVDTTVQPSEFTATWTGWHNASVKEWDGSQWNE